MPEFGEGAPQDEFSINQFASGIKLDASLTPDFQGWQKEVRANPEAAVGGLMNRLFEGRDYTRYFRHPTAPRVYHGLDPLSACIVEGEWGDTEDLQVDKTRGFSFSMPAGGPDRLEYRLNAGAKDPAQAINTYKELLSKFGFDEEGCSLSAVWDPGMKDFRILMGPNVPDEGVFTFVSPTNLFNGDRVDISEEIDNEFFDPRYEADSLQKFVQNPDAMKVLFGAVKFVEEASKIERKV